MSSKENTFVDYIINDVLGHIKGIRSRAMFGGYGLYKDDVIFAIIADDILYFKVDETNQSDYEAYNSEPFVYERGNHKRTTMSYWIVPDEILEDEDIVKKWLDKSVSISKKKQRE